MGILEKYMGKTMKVGSPEYKAWVKAASDQAWREETLAQMEEYEETHETPKPKQ